MRGHLADMTSDRRTRAFSVGADSVLVLASNPTASSTRRMCLSKVLKTLRESAWYWGPLASADAQKLLENTDDGTFLLRDSAVSRTEGSLLDMHQTSLKVGRDSLLYLLRCYMFLHS